MEQLTSLPSSKDVLGCSIFDLEKDRVTIDHLLGRLAELMIEAYVESKK